MIPDLPPFTCPQIDAVIDFIVDLRAYISDNGFGSTTIEDLSALYDLIELKADAVVATMEEIRERQSYFEEENHNYEAKIEELEDLISELRNQE